MNTFLLRATSTHVKSAHADFAKTKRFIGELGLDYASGDLSRENAVNVNVTNSIPDALKSIRSVFGRPKDTGDYYEWKLEIRGKAGTLMLYKIPVTGNLTRLVMYNF